MIATITGALILACVLSCDEEQESVFSTEKTEMKNEEKNRTKSNRSSDRSIVFDGTVGDPIDLAVALKWTENYRATIENPEQRLSHFFGFEIIQEILSQESCVGIRMYYALDDNGVVNYC